MKPFAGLLALLFLLPAAVIAQDENPVLSNNNEPHAILDLRQSPTAGALMVVRPIRIGERNLGTQAMQRRTFWIRPGEWEFQFAGGGSSATGSGTAGRARRGSRESRSTITATVEAGIRYNVAGVGLNDGTWSPVVWRITNEETGEVLYDLIEEVKGWKAEDKAEAEAKDKAEN